MARKVASKKTNGPADLVLSDGREIFLDMTKITLREFRELFKPSQDKTEEDKTLARVAGLTVEELQALPVPDWRSLAARFFEKAQEPAKEG